MSLPFEPLDFPAWIVWGQRSGATFDRTGWPDGPNGRPLCSWCQTEVPPKRRSWCSEECVRKFARVWSWGAVRAYVIRRDGERCTRCGTTDPEPPSDVRTDGWDVDHIIRVADGGTDDPANLRLLCNPCHIAVGYEQRAARRADAQSLPLFAGGAS